MYLKRKLFIPLFFMISMALGAYAQNDRNNYGALLEIDDVVLHGAGQSPDAFNLYFDLMPEDNKPVLYMYYITLNQIQSANWVDELKRELDRYPGQFLLPQIGVGMAPGDDPANHFEDDVAAGLYDQEISYLAQGLKSLGRPAYVRIGYEFNGIAWNGYNPGTYVQAFQKITDTIWNYDLEVATVWCAAVGGGTDSDYIDYYPGDNYVDWWGIDLFSESDFSEPLAASFMTDADNHGKPVMIGETTPRFIGADDDADWEDWFLKYFGFIDDNPGIKATCYINWNWANYPQWSNWGNAQLNQNDFVRLNYVHRLRNDVYQHAAMQKEFRELFSYIDNQAPDEVAISGTGDGILPIELNWQAVSDANKVLYNIYKNDDYYTSVYHTRFVDVNYAAGESYTYHVRAMDRAGNESDLSNALSYSLGDTIRKTINPDFAGTIYPWSLDSYNSAQSSHLASGDGVEISIDNSTGTNWHVQIVQEADVLEENEYYIETTASASESGQAAIIIQQNHEPFAIPLFQGITLQTTNTDFNTTKFKALENDQMNVGLYLGELNTGNKVTVDSFKLFEINGRDNFVENIVPLSDAGMDFIFNDPTIELELDGTGSFDMDGTIVSYTWKQLSGTEIISLNEPNAAKTGLSDLRVGDYVFRLTVVDDEGAIATDEISIRLELPSTSMDTVGCYEAISLPSPPAFLDSCDTEMLLTGPVESMVPNCEGVLSYTWTYEDCLGTTANYIHTVTIDLPASVAPAPTFDTIACNDSIVLPDPPVVLDACGNELNVSGPVESMTPDCGEEVSYTWSYEDCTGASIEYVHTVTIDSMTVSTTNLNLFDRISISPNPTSGFLRFSLENINPQMEVRIQVVDLHGRTVRQTSLEAIHIGNGSYTLDVSEIEGGVYFIHVITNEKKYTGKFIVKTY